MKDKLLQKEKELSDIILFDTCCHLIDMKNWDNKIDSGIFAGKFLALHLNPLGGNIIFSVNYYDGPDSYLLGKSADYYDISRKNINVLGGGNIYITYKSIIFKGESFRFGKYPVDVISSIAEPFRASFFSEYNIKYL